MERGPGVSVLRSARFGRAARAAAAAGVLAWVAASTARAEVFATPDQALAAAFPGARLERRSLALGAEQTRAVEKRARVRFAGRLITPHLAWRGDTLVGVGFFDTRVMR